MPWIERASEYFSGFFISEQIVKTSREQLKNALPEWLEMSMENLFLDNFSSPDKMLGLFNHVFVLAKISSHFAEKFAVCLWYDNNCLQKIKTQNFLLYRFAKKLSL